ncbi:MAG: AAA domain-containing protein [Xanthomonadales bacterium]|nr:AAA domain-containing protein [Xanthomonadales bacterium]
MQQQEVQEKLAQLPLVAAEIGKVIVGQTRIVDELLISVLAGGHCLLEGVPGLAKTLMVSTLAQSLELDFRRVQFTPDLMPSDIIGTEILEEDHVSGKRFFKFQQGPVFTNILLADEINRTPPKTQAALLEAMQERRISYAGEVYDLPQPFFVLATQNPVEQAGTYPLPEAQLDRFLMFIRVDYPSEQEEVEILARTTGIQDVQVKTILDAEDIIALQKLVREVEVSPALLDYIARIVRASRPGEDSNQQVTEYVRWGSGPRAGQSLVMCAKANALMRGHFAVTMDDIRFVAHAVLRHRILLNFQAEASGITTEDIINSLFVQVKQPQSPLD